MRMFTRRLVFLSIRMQYLIPGVDKPVDAASQRFVRMRPPRLEKTAEGVTLSLPHIRLDKALQFLLGDRLK